MPPSEPPSSDGPRTPTEAEANAIYNEVWPQALRFTRSTFRKLELTDAEDAAAYAVNRGMEKWQKDPEAWDVKRVLAYVIKSIKCELPKQFKRAIRRRKTEYDLPENAAANPDPLDALPGDARADGPLITNQGFSVAVAVLSLIEDEQRREILRLRTSGKMKPAEISKALGVSMEVINKHLYKDLDEYRRVMRLYVNGEQLPKKVLRQMGKESK